jgi:hypothetical protein
VVGQQWPEGRPRLDARVPVLGAGMLLPRHVAEIVDGGKVCCGGDVGEREAVAGKEAPALVQPGDLVEVIADVLVARADRR